MRRNWVSATIARITSRASRSPALIRKTPRRNTATCGRHWASGDYDAFVMTEMMRLSDAIKYHQTREYAREMGG